MMSVNLLSRKQTHFVLWRAPSAHPAPTLYIGSIPAEASNPYETFQEIPLQPSAHADLWEVAAQDCGLTDGVYFYWFKVQDSNPYSNSCDSATRILYCSDPVAYTIDRRFPAPAPAEPGGVASGDPASVILFQNGQLVPCDPDGKTADWQNDPALDSLPANDRLVIYELPTRWVRSCQDGGAASSTAAENVVGTGTFRDVVALLQAGVNAPSFLELEVLKLGHAHLIELGVNALELLPPADSAENPGDGKYDDQYKWGYGTANYFAADFDLGHCTLEPNSAKRGIPNASIDLANLIKVCHEKGIRFFLDMVMAFSRANPYRNINFADFYIRWQPIGDWQRDPEQSDREGFGGDLFKYNYWVEGYSPITGERSRLVPAREYMKTYLAHWLTYYRVDGLRLDSVNNIGNYDFLQEFKDLARSIWAQRGGADDRFLVVGEELNVPLALVQQNRLDGLWNERFKQMLREVVLGRSADADSFEGSVRKLIDCRLLGFRDGTQAINYITSHDVGGFGNERIYNYLANNGVSNIEARVKLAFVCLLTAVGIPLILAGDEFADQHDLDINQSADNKQVDPVNYSRLREPWRQRVFDYVARLVKFRTRSPALATNETTFLHVDFEEGKRVLVWQRGCSESLVVVVANFSDYGTPNAGSPHAEYFIPNWATAYAGKSWREITADRSVDSDWVGREPIFPWEAKVYALI